MTLRQFSRTSSQRNNGDSEITAVSTVDLSDETDAVEMRELVKKSRANARLAWKHFEAIGEVHKAISRSARIAGYARLRAVHVNPDGTDGANVDDVRVHDIVRSIYSPFGGVRGLIDRYFTLMKVPGESWLIRCRSDDDIPDGYHLLCADEIDESSIETFDPVAATAITWNTLPPSRIQGVADEHNLVVRIPGNDVLGRVFLPGRHWINLPDSPMKALSTECDVLYALTLSLKAKIRSRFATAGMFFVPSEIQDITVVGMGNQTVDLLQYLATAMSRNMGDWEDAKAWLPILLRGPGVSGEQIRHITLDREVFTTDLTLRQELIDRILFGLDISTQATKGSPDANHWGVWAQSDEEIRVAIQPDLDNFCWAMSRLILHPQAEALGVDASHMRIAWDMTESAVRTNRQEDTRQAHDRYLVGGEALVKISGLNPDEDLMGDAEYVRKLGRELKNPVLATHGLDVPEDLMEKAKEWAAKPGPGSNETPESETGPGVGDPGSPNDQESPQP